MTANRQARRQFLKFLAASPLCNGLAELAHAAVEDGQRIASPELAIDIFDLKATAREILPPAHYGYMATGTNSDKTLRANREAFDNYYLRSRRLIDVLNIDMRVEILGKEYPSPIVIAPCGSQRAFHADGELAVARAANKLNHLQILSTVSSTPIEQVAEARGEPIWFQLYTLGGWPGVRKMLPPRRSSRLSGCGTDRRSADEPKSRKTHAGTRDAPRYAGLRKLSRRVGAGSASQTNV